MKFIKNKPEELDFNEVVMRLIKESREDGVEGIAEFQYLICHANVKYLVNVQVNGIKQQLDRLGGECDYKTSPGG